MIREGSIVTLHYAGTLADGEQFDSSEGKEPLVVTVGQGQLIPGFEKELIGMKTGEKKKFTVPKEDAYAYHQELVVKIPKHSAPPELDIKIGALLVLKAPNGQRVPGKVVAIDDSVITVDMNVPVAGKDLTFEIEIVKIE